MKFTKLWHFTNYNFMRKRNPGTEVTPKSEYKDLVNRKYIFKYYYIIKGNIKVNVFFSKENKYRNCVFKHKIEII
jgi:hypothetical protein